MFGGMFDEEISTSRPLFVYNISILVVWVNHLINLKVQFTKSKSQRIKEIKNKEHKAKKGESLEVLSWGSRYILSSHGLGLLCASSFIFMGCCVWKACV